MLGTEGLLLPILYIETRDLSSESPDEAVALVAKTQHVDWHKNRLLEPSSREYRIAVNALAQRLLDIARDVADIQLKHELSSDLEDDGVDGITDIVMRIEALIPDWLDAVMGEKSVAAQILAIWNQHEEQVLKLRKRKAPPSAILSARIRLAREMLPIAERALKDSQMYVARSVELDPLVSALARLVAEHPESFPLVAPIRETIDEAVEEIQKADRTSFPGSVEYEFLQMSHLGRIFQQCSSAFTARVRNAKEGNDIVRRWAAELTEYDNRQSEQSDSTTSNEPEEVNAEEPDQQ
jgi:hypothetical protein